MWDSILSLLCIIIKKRGKVNDTLKSKIDKKGVIAYTGSFGTGKTTALKNFFRDNKEYEVIFFNAWEFDYSDKAKLTFINELLISIIKVNEFEIVKELGREALKKAWNLVKNYINFKGIDWNDNSSIDNYIKNYTKEWELLEELKRTIKLIADKSKNDIVIVIDDLDRSRPDFSLEVFEIAKHIFDVDNISIILVYDSESMNNIIQTKYGKTGGESYLSKYIDFEHPHIPVKIESDYFTNLDLFEHLTIKYPDEDISIRTIMKFKDNYGKQISSKKSIHSYKTEEELLFFIFLFAKMIDPNYLQYVKRDGKIKLTHREDLLEIFEKFEKEGAFKSEEWVNANDFIKQMKKEFIDQVYERALKDAINLAPD